MKEYTNITRFEAEPCILEDYNSIKDCNTYDRTYYSGKDHNGYKIKPEGSQRWEWVPKEYFEKWFKEI